MSRLLEFVVFLSLIVSCKQQNLRSAIPESDDKTEMVAQKEEEYSSGANKRFKSSFINRPGLFFDDFEELPRHVHPNDFNQQEGITRYSYHSVVEKEENWKPRNNALEIKDRNGVNYLSSTLSPGQFHQKIQGYRAELTLHGGNPELKEEWYEWRFRIPENYILDRNNEGREVSIVQFHYVKPKEEEKVITGPTIMFTYLEQYDRNMLLLRYGINGEDKSRYDDFKWRIVALEDGILKGRWYTIRVNIKWSLNNQGYIAAWLNGKPYTPFNGIHNKVFGANLYNDIENTFKFGFYRYWDNSKPTPIEFDYIIKTRSVDELTGRTPTSKELYGPTDSYEYLENKEHPLFDICLLPSVRMSESGE
jgi:hypothetical protein